MEKWGVSVRRESTIHIPTYIRYLRSRFWRKSSLFWLLVLGGATGLRFPVGPHDPPGFKSINHLLFRHNIIIKFEIILKTFEYLQRVLLQKRSFYHVIILYSTNPNLY